MSAMMIASTALLIAATANHGGASGGGASCPVSSFGVACLIAVGVMMGLAMVSFVLGMTRDYFSKWFVRWFCVSAVLTIGTLVPIIAGMIHDCH